MENLPLEITSYIISGLPIVLRLQCREVCRTWRSLVPRLPRMGLLFRTWRSLVTNDKAGEAQAEFYFSGKNHVKVINLGHSLIMPSSSVTENFMVGSCNGLVCYAGKADSMSCERKFYICNPVTGEQIQLPDVDSGRYSERAIGFGYNRSGNDYKVVRILVDTHFEYIMIQVYILGNKWFSRRIAGGKRLFPHLSDLPSAGVFAGEALHWIREDNTKPMIVAFDLKEETVKLLPSVPWVSLDTENVRLLMELGGNLCALEVVPSKHVTIWEHTNKKKRRRSDSPWVKGRLISPWVPKLSIAWEDYSWFEPFALTKSAKSLLWYNVVLSRYDLETKTLRKLDETLKKLEDDSSVYTTTRATPHMNSLVSLKLEFSVYL